MTNRLLSSAETTPWPLTTTGLATPTKTPSSPTATGEEDLAVGGVRLAEIAATYGTPAYVLDEADVRARARAYRAALPEAEIAYAGKAFLCRAMITWIEAEGLSLDVCSGGELALARHVGFPPERIVLHGNAKTPRDVQDALAYGVGRVVVDSTYEITQLAVAAHAGRPQKVLIRVTPGIDAHTYKAVATGVEDQKFGFSLSTGAAADAVRQVLHWQLADKPALELAGLHCHLGSQITSVDVFAEAARRLIALMAWIRDEYRVTVPELDLGGGHAVGYRDGDPDFDLDLYARTVRTVIAKACRQHRLPVPELTVEPGRAIVAKAGVTLYRVLTMKRIPGVRTFVAVDGGMSDNPRPALYGSAYTARLIGRASAAPTEPMTVVGRHCEAGDVLAHDLPLPADLRPGDLLAVPCTGAYQHSMASTYNQVCRPPVIAVRDGVARVLIRRETLEDLQARDVSL
ncbi:diaminopimelate decarboxylase [Catenulispora sp. GAS73]|uniref:diaminopimelate decarboxylase n=1 Tax=Catenulispora sp. GAS73 TaxID=3156269 RepID=UPI0035116474